ncbi:TolB family protein [Neosynechococcus sphagnicola]|uniref:TolB family protein n=1 Tax=Neosynechococcus sphagnicola TaxID=1501145 RepID=UPI000566305D|nr:PD40 domain-containing protein [Neosynechococcus sphagnicola]
MKSTQPISLLLAIAALLGSCTSAPRLLSFPFDAAGRSLNSPFMEATPRMAGRFLVFVSDRRGSQDIYLFDAVERRLVDLPGLNALDLLATSPAVSADGRTIVFVGSRQGQSDLYLYNRDTTQLQNLTDNLPAQVSDPTISADGSTIAFAASINGQWDILVYNRFGQPLNIPVEPR